MGGIRVKGRKVSWHRLLWFPLHIPKQSIIAWMAILNRLPTRDCLVSMGRTVDAGCLLQSYFFECGFSKKVWKLELQLCNVLYVRRTVGSWNQVLTCALSKFKGIFFTVAALKLAYNACVNVISFLGDTPSPS
ncbi:reverse transcriptase [Gossypium australe]|uniref:Reverse transcriptase n=1 Tax=Gossypium australe TaxID=47621 RepID=A0A5B6WCR0_9ROSI|nr:reverse transcriptase [Gossypium australe]